MSKDLRATIVIDFTVDDDTDEDEFHDELRIQLEDPVVIDHLTDEIREVESVLTVRDITIEAF